MATKFTQYRMPDPALVEQRGAERHRVFVARAKVSRGRSQPAEASLHDVSIYGCRLQGMVPHRPGDRVWLRLDDSNPIPARIAWNDGSYLGCRFEEPIDRKLMRMLTLSMGRC